MPRLIELLLLVVVVRPLRFPYPLIILISQADGLICTHIRCLSFSWRYFVSMCTHITCMENDILWRVTAETEALKKKESQVSSTVSILLVVVLFLIIIIIIIYRCEIFSLALYMPPPVAVRHLSMSRRQRAEKRRRGREKQGGEELDKIIYVYICMCVCVGSSVCVHTLEFWDEEIWISEE